MIHHVQLHPFRGLRRLAALGVVLCVLPLVFWLVWALQFHLVGDRLFLHTLIGTLFLVIPFHLVLRLLLRPLSLVPMGKYARRRVLGLAVAFYAVSWILVVYPAAVTLNCGLDFREPRQMSVTVTKKWTTKNHKKARKYRVQLEGAEEGAPVLVARVSRAQYEQAEAGATQGTFVLHKGLLGYEWFSGLQLASARPAGS